MPTPTDRKTIYRECRESTGLNKRRWGRLFALGSLKSSAQIVDKKENPATPGPGSTSKGVNMAEALAAQLLRYLHEQGYDIDAAEFDDAGRLLALPTRGPLPDKSTIEREES